MKPFVKWAGGKTQLLDKIKQYLPKEFNRYFEPFVGGGAVLFALRPKEAYINDLNFELITAYRVLNGEQAQFDRLLTTLDTLWRNHSESHYYVVRDIDRAERLTDLAEHGTASRFIYLNKACFNGLYRVNSKGYFNAPSGHKEKMPKLDVDNLKEIREYFKTSNIQISNLSYELACEQASAGDFVYFDPPYDYEKGTKGFTAYTKSGFGPQEQEKLAQLFKQLSDKGVYCMLSNNNTKFIQSLYNNYNIHIVSAKRMINCDGEKRGAVEEVIITNY